MSKDFLEEIKIKWNENNLQECSKHLDKLLYSATTGSELTEVISLYLMKLKHENGLEYKIAKREINKYLGFTIF